MQVFIVDVRANKKQIKEAVGRLYDIQTQKINTLIRCVVVKNQCKACLWMQLMGATCVLYFAMMLTCAVQGDAMNVGCTGSRSCSCCKAFLQTILSICLCLQAGWCKEGVCQANNWLRCVGCSKQDWHYLDVSCKFDTVISLLAIVPQTLFSASPSSRPIDACCKHKQLMLWQRPGWPRSLEASVITCRFMRGLAWNAQLSADTSAAVVYQCLLALVCVLCKSFRPCDAQGWHRCDIQAQANHLASLMPRPAW